MNYTRMTGDYVELKCMSEFVKFGYPCLIPYGCWATYDFVVDFNGTFLKIQCKDAQLYYNKDEIISFTIKCNDYISSDIDYFATIFEDDIYLLPGTFAGSKITLKVNDSSSDRYYKKYAFDCFIPINQDFIDSKESFINSRMKGTKYYCIDCGKEISRWGTRCPDCANKNERIVERPNKTKLKELVRNKSFSEIGKMYNVSDNAIRKWCKQEDIPCKKSDIKQISDSDWENI